MPETTKAVLTKSIKLPDPIPEIGIERANKLMRNGRIYRYNADSAETCEVRYDEGSRATALPYHLEDHVYSFNNESSPHKKCVVLY